MGKFLLNAGFTFSYDVFQHQAFCSFFCSPKMLCIKKSIY
ncbi:hypothetical protein MmTuc01_1595 [Methanosarcina mazei Tuc01]|uniref:Uncharacterized protein n=1 Tax=Methanosarcina mazei Tuc01 TaxID=1236903 RepID=M1PXH4_METMZ|nr:hypothetical protein MmTuc01_1595 [Methanosarcina mazei Tuc01]